QPIGGRDLLIHGKEAIATDFFDGSPALGYMKLLCAEVTLEGLWREIPGQYRDQCRNGDITGNPGPAIVIGGTQCLSEEWREAAGDNGAKLSTDRSPTVAGASTK